MCLRSVTTTLVLLLLLINFSYQGPMDVSEHQSKIIMQCREKFDVIIDDLREPKLPEEKKCFFECLYVGLGVLTPPSHEVNVEALKTTTFYEDGAIEKCVGEVAKEGDLCDYSANFRYCCKTNE